jgi:hypothetical protein
MSDEQMRAEFEVWVRAEWPTAPLHHVRDALPKDDPRYGEYVNESIRFAWFGWKASRAALVVKLTDDGDALRLAVKLKMTVDVTPWGCYANRWDDPKGTAEQFDDDPNAATRRAIVRAAAEIGRAK